MFVTVFVRAFHAQSTCMCVVYFVERDVCLPKEYSCFYYSLRIRTELLTGFSYTRKSKKKAINWEVDVFLFSIHLKPYSCGRSDHIFLISNLFLRIASVIFPNLILPVSVVHFGVCVCVWLYVNFGEIGV